jgi:hypothetical protein
MVLLLGKLPALDGLELVTDVGNGSRRRRDGINYARKSFTKRAPGANVVKLVLSVI